MGELAKIQSWYNDLIEDIKLLESTGIVATKHAIGKRILEDFEKFGNPEYGEKRVENIAKDAGMGRRDIFNCLRFAQKYPELCNAVAQLSWRKIANELLIENPKEKPKIAPFPDGKYSVIYADPSWPVDSIVMDKWESPIDDKYPTMIIEDIKNLPVDVLTAEDCSLFLWTTHSFLPDSLDIIKAWGFKYFCLITWNKGSGWTQNGFHKMTEFLLFAYKGKMNIYQYGKAIPTLINENKTIHSKKPDSIRDLIKSKTPESRVELFARIEYLSDEQKEGWIFWGNEIKIENNE